MFSWIVIKLTEWYNLPFWKIVTETVACSSAVFVFIIEHKVFVFLFFYCLWFLLRYCLPFNKPSLFRWLHLLLMEVTFMRIWFLDFVSSHQVTTVFRAFIKISICWGLGLYCICNKKAGNLTARSSFWSIFLL